MAVCSLLVSSTCVPPLFRYLVSSFSIDFYITGDSSCLNWRHQPPESTDGGFGWASSTDRCPCAYHAFSPIMITRATLCPLAMDRNLLSRSRASTVGRANPPMGWTGLNVTRDIRYSAVCTPGRGTPGRNGERRISANAHLYLTQIVLSRLSDLVQPFLHQIV